MQYEPVCLVPLRGGPSAKLRLSHVLSADERAKLVEAMAAHVVRTLSLAGLPVSVVRENGGLNRALRSALGTYPALIVPADLPWLRVSDVWQLLEEPSDVVVALAADGGTNALLLRRPLEPAFGRGSGLGHLAAARAQGLSARGVVIDGFREDLDDEVALRRALWSAPAFA